MLPFDEAIDFMQRMCVDTSTPTLSFLKSMYNVGYQSVLDEFGQPPIEVTSTTTLVAGQREYQMPPDCTRPVSLSFYDGTTVQPILEVADDKAWALMISGGISGRPSYYHYRPRFGVGGGVLELSPVPSSAYVLHMIYEATDRELSHLKYITGTITLTANSQAVTGASTVFTSDMIGRYLRPTGDGQDRLPYRITAVTNGTTLTLENNYAGAGGSSLAYEIIELPNLPVAMHILPAQFAIWQHYSSKGNAVKSAEYEKYYTLGMAKAKRNNANSTGDDTVLTGYGYGLAPFDSYPLNFPLNITS